LVSSFFKESDQGQIYVSSNIPTRYDLNQTVKRVHEVEEMLKDLPELKHTLTAIGRVEGVIVQASEGVYLAQMLLNFPKRMNGKSRLKHLWR
jgi:HAE1 family hydrophobic/amphiphilic exporter-1